MPSPDAHCRTTSADDGEAVERISAFLDTVLKTELVAAHF
jgi:hypothetical protein